MGLNHVARASMMLKCDAASTTPGEDCYDVVAEAKRSHGTNLTGSEKLTRFPGFQMSRVVETASPFSIVEATATAPEVVRTFRTYATA